VDSNSISILNAESASDAVKKVCCTGLGMLTLLLKVGVVGVDGVPRLEVSSTGGV
jgi:hypothetical protein